MSSVVPRSIADLTLPLVVSPVLLLLLVLWLWLPLLVLSLVLLLWLVLLLPVLLLLLQQLLLLLVQQVWLEQPALPDPASKQEQVWVALSPAPLTIVGRRAATPQ